MARRKFAHSFGRAGEAVLLTSRALLVVTHLTLLFWPTSQGVLHNPQLTGVERALGIFALTVSFMTLSTVIWMVRRGTVALFD